MFIGHSGSNRNEFFLHVYTASSMVCQLASLMHIGQGYVRQSPYPAVQRTHLTHNFLLLIHTFCITKVFSAKYQNVETDTIRKKCFFKKP